MIRRPPRSTRTDTLFPYTTLFRSIIASSQVKDFLGLSIAEVPAEFIPKWQAYIAAIATISWATVGVGAGALAIIIVLRKVAPKLPGFLIAVVVSALAVALLKLPVDTVGSRFPAIPAGLPLPSLPDVAFTTNNAVLVRTSVVWGKR